MRLTVNITKMKKLFFSFLPKLIVLLCAALTACKADVDLNDISPEVELETALSLPVGSAIVTLDDLYNEFQHENLHEDADGGYFIEYADSYGKIIPEIKIENRLHLADSSFNFDSQFPYLPCTFPAGTSRTFSFDLGFSSDSLTDNLDADFFNNFSFDRKKAKEIKPKVSDIENVRKVIGTDSRFVFVITKNAAMGIEYSDIDSITVQFDKRVFEFTDNSTNRFKIPLANDFGEEIFLDLPPFVANFEDEAGNKIKNVDIEFLLHIKTKDTRTFSKGTLSNIGIDVDKFEVKTVYGDYNIERFSDEFDLDISDEIDFSEYENWYIPLSNPEIFITTQTNLGLPINITLDDVQVELYDGSIVSADFNGSSKYSCDLDLPISLADTSINELPVIDRDYGNLDKLITKFPKNFHCSWRAHNYDRSYSSYLLSGSFFNLYFKLKIPLAFNKNFNAQYADTIADVTLPDVSLIETDVNLEAYLVIKNSLPLSVEAKFVFLDENNNDLELVLLSSDDSAPNNLILPMPDVDGEGNVTEAVETLYKVKLSTIDDFYAIDKIAYDLKVTDHNNKAKLNSKNALSIDLALGAEGSVLLNLDSIK